MLALFRVTLLSTRGGKILWRMRLRLSVKDAWRLPRATVAAGITGALWDDVLGDLAF